jgi:acyl-CoA dehydrogenase
VAYRAPEADIRFILRHVVGFPAVAATERFAEATPETVDAILTEAGRLAEGVLAPLQKPGDRHPARLENGVVRCPPGFAEGWRAIAEGGWLGLAARPEAGGMGLPAALATAVNDMMSGACLALETAALLTIGQIEALEHHGDARLKARVLPRLVAGDWIGTMNLTEPQAGSDVGALTTRAEPEADGSFRITGQKIYITWGDAEFADNISHLVLARLPDAPGGARGISLFWVPKRDPDTGAANGVRPIGVEHKMGLHGSPTVALAYEGARGWIVGEPNGGLPAMFTMMNNARLAVGVQGIGQAEAALQLALAHAEARVQGRTPEGREPTILGHPDVRRMLAVMRAEVFAARALAFDTAVAIDMAAATGDPAWAARAGFLTPIAKAHGTDTGVAVAGVAMQVQGGMGYIEETGAAQYLRDVRVSTIYEGTNGIQAMDLVGRKLADGGAAAFALLDGLRDPELSEPAVRLRRATEWMLAADLADRGAGAAAYLRAWARVLGAAHHRAAARAEGGGGPRAALARVFLTRCLPEHAALLTEATAGAEALYALDRDGLAA